MDAYEDPLRHSALERLLGPGGGRKLLDAGCGTGRWSVRLAQVGWIVTGVDFSQELIRLASPAPNVTYLASPIQDLKFPDGCFDAWLSVTALQHVTSPVDFEAALDNLTRLLRSGGMAALLEYAPVLVMSRMPSNMRTRSRQEWIGVMTSRGYVKRAESGVRFLGYAPYMIAVRLLSRFGVAPHALNALRSVCWALDLFLARIPLITRLADVRLLVFEKPG